MDVDLLIGKLIIYGPGRKLRQPINAVYGRDT
jgi:hypothetical protein